MCESAPSEPNWLVLPGAPPVGSRPEQLVKLIHQVSGRVALNRDSPALGSPDTPPCRALEATRPDLPEAALQVEDLGHPRDGRRAFRSPQGPGRLQQGVRIDGPTQHALARKLAKDGGDVAGGCPTGGQKPADAAVQRV